MYSASPPLQQHYTSSIDRRRPSSTMESSPQQPQQAWLQSTMIQQQQQPQETGLNYMVHHGYPVVPKPTVTAPSHYHQQQYQHHPANINSKQQTVNRAVIPSKRAAQNRAAQKAFRQRREQYVKDLEKKSKEMDQWQQDRDSVMNENRRLKNMVHQLQSRIASLTGEPMPPSTPPPSFQDEQQQQQHTFPSPLPLSSPPRMSSSPTSSIRRTSHGPSLSPTTPSIPSVPLIAATVNGRSISSSPPPVPRQTTTMLPSSSSSSSSSSARRPIHPTSSSSSASSPTTPSHSLLPISLRPHSFVPSKEDDLPIPSPSSPPPSFSNVAPAGQIASTLPDTRPTMFELDLDPFFDDDFGGFPRMDDQLDFVGHPNNSGQVLDDLFAMLQTRQRPQIPLQSTSNGDEVPYYIMDPVVTNHSSG